MTGEELRELERSMIRSVELRTNAMFESHGLSTAILLDSSAQAPPISPEVKNIIDSSEEPMSIIKPPLVLVGSNASTGADTCRSQLTQARSKLMPAASRAPKSEKKPMISSDVKDSGSSATNGAQKTSTDEEMLFIPSADRSSIRCCS
uniref:Uncharacterized protein n=1 Tax=Cannabis sativa TaxID=3483 RepID=A0A803PS59_CANSA